MEVISLALKYNKRNMFLILKCTLQSMLKFNPLPNKPLFSCVCSTSLLKTLWKKEKLLVTSNFFFYPQCLSTLLDSFPPFSSNLKLSSAKSLSLEESKICYSGTGLSICRRPMWPKCFLKGFDTQCENENQEFIF